MWTHTARTHQGSIWLGQPYSLLSSVIFCPMSGVIPTQSPWYHLLQWSQQITSSGIQHKQYAFEVEATTSLNFSEQSSRHFIADEPRF